MVIFTRLHFFPCIDHEEILIAKISCSENVCYSHVRKIEHWADFDCTRAELLFLAFQKYIMPVKRVPHGAILSWEQNEYKSNTVV